MKIDIFSKDFQIAVDQIQKRAELGKIEKIVDSFVDIPPFGKVRMAESQVIKGRRGTGKSHILLYHSTILSQNFEENKIISLYINLEEAFMDLKDLKLADPEMATFLFNNLLLILTQRLYHFVNEQIKPNIFERITGLGERQKQLEIKREIERLAWLALYGSPVFVSKELLDKNRQLAKKSSKSKRKIDVQSDLATLKVGLALSDEVIDTAEMENEVIRTSSGLNVLRASEIIKYLEATVKGLGAEYLYLFLDQWSDIMEVDVQPHFADLVKHVFLSNPHIRVKIAITPTIERLKVPTARKGLQLGRDIFKAVDLDEELLFTDKMVLPIEFYSSLLRKHIGVYYKPFRDLGEEDYRSVIHFLFDELNTFEECIIAGGGVARDFLIIFANAYSNLLRDKGKLKVGLPQVNKASLDYASEKIEDIRHDKFLKRVYEKILTSKFLDKKLPTFMIPYTSQSEEVDRLLYSRLLHEVPAKVLIPEVAGKCRVFLLDHGLRVLNDIIMDNQGFFENTFQLKTDRTAHLLTERSFTAEVFRVFFPKPVMQAQCPICGKLFFKNSKLYREYGICPNCHEVVDPVKYHGT